MVLSMPAALGLDPLQQEQERINHGLLWFCFILNSRAPLFTALKCVVTQQILLHTLLSQTAVNCIPTTSASHTTLAIKVSLFSCLSFAPPLLQGRGE